MFRVRQAVKVSIPLTELLVLLSKFAMKFYVLLLLCFAVALGEKKINLEDIERDNLQSEAQTDEDNVRTDEAKYNSDNTESNAQSQYRTEFRLIGGQQPQETKYVVQPEAYNQESQAYQQQQEQQQQYSAALAAQQQQAPQQFYVPRYQPETVYQAQKGSPQISYQPQVSQGLTYQSEIPIGNQIQSYQQKAATHKFSQGVGKATRYANIASSGNQQLLYYPNLNAVSNLKSQIQPLLHRLAGEAARKVPAYTKTVTQEPRISYQLQPQIQYVYEPQYVQPANPTYAVKNTQKFTYAVPAAPQTYSPPQAYSGLTYSQQSSLYTQPKLAYTQAYYVQPQLNQYYQEPAYSSVPQGNSLSYSQTQPLYIPANLVQQLQTQILEQQGSHSIAQNYAKVPEEPRYSLTLPQVSAQNFKNGGITQLRPVHPGISQTSNQLRYSSGYNSLLESYTPSHIIAAQDSERYRERPLHLEGGFLPSKGSYVHSHNEKRKSEKA